MDRTNFDDDWVELLFLPVALFDQSLAVTHTLTQPLVESIHIPDVAKVSWIIGIAFSTLCIRWIEGDEIEAVLLICQLLHHTTIAVMELQIQQIDEGCE